MVEETILFLAILSIWLILWCIFVHYALKNPTEKHSRNKNNDEFCQ